MTSYRYRHVQKCGLLSELLLQVQYIKTRCEFTKITSNELIFGYTVWNGER